MKSCKTWELESKYLTTSTAWALTEEPSGRATVVMLGAESQNASPWDAWGRGDIVCAAERYPILHPLLGERAQPGALERAECRVPGGGLSWWLLSLGQSALVFKTLLCPNLDTKEGGLTPSHPPKKEQQQANKTPSSSVVSSIGEVKAALGRGCGRVCSDRRGRCPQPR